MTSFDIIAAADDELGIGKDGGLPWHVREDMRYFQKVTSETEAPDRRNAVVMGRKTWESIPDRFRPLPGRLNVVVTRNRDYAVPDGVLVAHSLTEGLQLATEPPAGAPTETVFVVGGGALYEQALSHPDCRRFYLTRIEGRFGCDTFLPPWGDRFKIESATEPREDKGVRYAFHVLVRRGRG